MYSSTCSACHTQKIKIYTQSKAPLQTETPIARNMSAHLFDTILRQKLDSVIKHRHIGQRQQNFWAFECHGTESLREAISQNNCLKLLLSLYIFRWLSFRLLWLLLLLLLLFRLVLTTFLARRVVLLLLFLLWRSTHFASINEVHQTQTKITQNVNEQMTMILPPYHHVPVCVAVIAKNLSIFEQ